MKFRKLKRILEASNILLQPSFLPDNLNEFVHARNVFAFTATTASSRCPSVGIYRNTVFSNEVSCFEAMIFRALLGVLIFTALTAVTDAKTAISPTSKTWLCMIWLGSNRIGTAVDFALVWLRGPSGSPDRRIEGFWALRQVVNKTAQVLDFFESIAVLYRNGTLGGCLSDVRRVLWRRVPRISFRERKIALCTSIRTFPGSTLSLDVFLPETEKKTLTKTLLKTFYHQPGSLTDMDATPITMVDIL